MQVLDKHSTNWLKEIHAFTELKGGRVHAGGLPGMVGINGAAPYPGIEGLTGKPGETLKSKKEN